MINQSYWFLIDSCLIFKDESEEQENTAPNNKRLAEASDPPPAKKSKLGKKTKTCNV